jgi:hypothetical protein
MSGKGSGRRPQVVGEQEMEARWLATFGKTTPHTGEQDVGSTRERESGASDSLRLPDGPGGSSTTGARRDSDEDVVFPEEV